MKRDGTRIQEPASPRQQWIVEIWNKGTYEGYRMYPTQQEAENFANNYDLLLAEFREKQQP